MKNIDLYFIVAGFDHGHPFITKFTFTELANNEGEYKDTEMFYALQEQPEKVCHLQVGDMVEVTVSRDEMAISLAHITRVPKDRYNQTI